MFWYTFTPKMAHAFVVVLIYKICLFWMFHLIQQSSHICKGDFGYEEGTKQQMLPGRVRKEPRCLHQECHDRLVDKSRTASQLKDFCFWVLPHHRNQSKAPKGSELFIKLLVPKFPSFAGCCRVATTNSRTPSTQHWRTILGLKIAPMI